MPRLNILSGKREGQVVELEPGSSYQVGTGRAADIQLRDKGVGFKHATLSIEDGKVFVEDLKSRGGTFVNGEKLEAHERVEVRATDGFQIGTVELKLEGLAASAPAPETEPEPVAAEPEPVAAEPEPEPEPVAAEPEPEPEPTKLSVEIDEAAVASAMTPTSELSSDLDVLKDQCRQLQKALAEKTQEAKAYEEAFESQGAGGGAVEAYDDGLGGYSSEVQTNLEATILELRHQADELSSHVEEKNEVIRQLEKENQLLRDQNKEALADVDRQRRAAEDGMVRSMEKVEAQRDVVTDAQAEVEQFQQVNTELLLETEELKERLEAMAYQLDQEHARRGQLVRERVVELRKEAERLEQSNAEMRTLVEAYEEKIDELDERVEELEGECEAHEQLVTDLRKDLSKAKQDRDTMVKTLRKKLKGLEQKLERAQGESARARAAAEAS